MQTISNNAACVTDLRALFPSSKLSTAPDVLASHSECPWFDHPVVGKYDAVIFAESTEDVVQAVKTAVARSVPIVAYAGGTSIEGQYSAPKEGGICVDISRMNAILQINERDGDLVCQAGAKWDDINTHLRSLNIPLFFPVDPAPGAAIGGMIATGCSGTNAVRYGTARSEWILNATVVLPSGEVIKTRSRARKSAAGFDLTKLFIGSEGTLGIVTEATIRLAPLLPTVVAYAQFPSIRAASEATIDLLNTGIALQCVELCDQLIMKGINLAALTSIKYAEVPTLFIKLQGSQEQILSASQVARPIFLIHGAENWHMAVNDAESEEIWKARKGALLGVRKLRPDAKVWGTDVCVPISLMPDLIFETQQDFALNNIFAPILAHAGDGNIHAAVHFTEDEAEKAKLAVNRLVERAIKMNGTCTGEHGVGVAKKSYITQELGEGTVELMKLIKRAIDPLGLFNPGKLYPDPEASTPNEGA